MHENLDQIFVSLQHWLVGYLPAALQPLGGVVLGVVAIVMSFSGALCLDHSL